MIVMFLLALLALKLKGHRISEFYKIWPLYPYYLLEVFYLICQVSVFSGYFGFLPLAVYLQKAYILVMLVPLFCYALYKPALLGAGLVITGTALNNAVKAANGGLMPVYPTLSYITGYFSQAGLAADTVHTLGDAATRLKFLADYIDIGWSILSIGDLMIHACTFVFVYATIAAAEQTQKGRIVWKR